MQRGGGSGARGRNVRWSEHAAVEFAEAAAYVAREFGSQAAVKEEIYIVSIWSNRQNRAKLYSTLRADANGM